MAGLRTGISRGLFTNEAGLGSIPMAAATAQHASPRDQALVSMTGPFWDTVVMCAITGIASVSSMITHPGNYAGVPGERMCFAVFRELPVWGDEMLSVSLVLFAFATIIGWNVYGECAVRYLFGEKGVRIYQVVYMMCVYFGAVITLDVVWGISDLFNFLMAVPNLICLLELRREIDLFLQNQTWQDDIYFMRYTAMRREQCRVLQVMYRHLLRLNQIPEQATPLSAFLKEIAQHFHEGNDCTALLEQLEEQFAAYRRDALPETRAAFENRAILYSILTELRSFLEIKQRFYLALPEQERKQMFERLTRDITPPAQLQ